MNMIPRKDEPQDPVVKMDRVEQLTRQLEEDIALGRLKPRERLIEDELMQRFDTKRNVVRQVLFELDKLGMVARARNKGAFVTCFSPKEIEDIYVVRELLEGKAIELIPLPVSAPIIEELRRIHNDYMEAKQKGIQSVVFRKNIDFHKTIYQACNNPALFEAIELYMMKSHAIRSYSFTSPELIDQMAEEHLAMIEALLNSDLQLLKNLMMEHLKPAREIYYRLNKL